MKINLIFRNHAAGYSIYNIFKDFFRNVSKLTLLESVVLSPFANLKSIMKNMRYVFGLRKTADVFHVTGDIHYCILALPFKKRILTIADTVALDATKNRLKWLFLFLLWFYLPCKFSSRVICISETTKKRLLKYIKHQKCSVIYCSVSPEFEFKFKIFNKRKPIILQIGTGWNKNLHNVIKSVKGIDCILRIIGSLNSESEKLLHDNNIIYSQCTDLTSLEVVNEYIMCDIVSFPSIYEGFGLPIVEGQTVGRVVLTSNINPMVEVGGENAAYYVNPYSVEEIRNGFIELINNDVLRETIIRNGINNSKRFDLEKIIEQYTDIYLTC